MPLISCAGLIHPEPKFSVELLTCKAQVQYRLFRSAFLGAMTQAVSV